MSAPSSEPMPADVGGLWWWPLTTVLVQSPVAEAPPRPARTPGWLPWLLLRLASGIGTVWMLSVIVFVATQALPSDPARVILGPEAPEETVQILQRQLGLDRPLLLQYRDWLAHVARGDFGRSLDSQVPVSELVGDRLDSTLTLLVTVTLTTLPLAFALGILLALVRDSRLDRTLVALLISLKALPSFAVALALMYALAVALPLLPAVSLLDPAVPAFAQPQYLVLPTATLLLGGLPYLVRLVRGSMIEALESEYVAMARLRGIPESRIVLWHALPNALIPAVQGVALMLSALIGGALVAEVVFTYPGIGSALNAAVEMRDLPVIQAIVLLVTAGVVGINLLADLLTVMLTPRLRTARRARFITRRLRRSRSRALRAPLPTASVMRLAV